MPQHWYNIFIGRSDCHLDLTYNTKKHEIACELYINDNKDLYYSLEQYKEDELASEKNDIPEIFLSSDGTNMNKVNCQRDTNDGLILKCDLNDTIMIQDGFLSKQM